MNNTMTPEFRASYPNVFRPKKNELNQKDEYSVVALFPKGTDLSGLKKAATKAIEEKWGTDKSKWPSNLKSPFRDQGDRAKISSDGKKVLPMGYEEGATYVNLKSEQRPGVVDQNVQPIIEASQFYAGCFARATVRAFAYDQKGNRGVSFGLQNIQKMRDGDPLGGRVRAEDDFSPVGELVANGGGGQIASSTSIFD
jgi:hypothetical protein